SWLKKVGDKIEEGDILAEIETDKATMEFESFHSGTLLYIGIEEGQGAPVDSLLAIIGPEGTNVDAVLGAHSSGDGSSTAPDADPVGEKSPKDESTPSKEVPVGAQDGQRILPSPLAKRIAEEKGIDLSELKGSGDHGRIVKRDVENHQPSQKTASMAPQAETTAGPALTPITLPVGEEGMEEVKNSTMRKVIAKRLGESKYSAPHYYLTIEVDMDNAKASRAQINNLPDTKVSFNDMVLK